MDHSYAMRASAMGEAYEIGSGGSNFDVRENNAPAASFTFQPGEVVLAMHNRKQWWPAMTANIRQALVTGFGSKVGYPLAYFHQKNSKLGFVKEKFVKPFEDLPLENVKHQKYFETLKASFQLAKMALEIPHRERYAWWMHKGRKLQMGAYVSCSHSLLHISSRTKKTPKFGACSRSHPSKSSGTRKTLEVSSSIPITLDNGYYTKKIALVSESHPWNQLTATDTENIRMMMDNLIKQMWPGDECPLILKSKFERGALLIDCADEFSLDWVIRYFKGREWCGKKIKAVPVHSLLSDTVMIALETTDVFTVDPSMLFQSLAWSNPGLNTTKWESRDWCRLVEGEDLFRRRRARWIIEIDEASARTLREKNMNLFVNFGKAWVEILDGVETPRLLHKGVPITLRPRPHFASRRMHELWREAKEKERERRYNAAVNPSSATLDEGVERDIASLSLETMDESSVDNSSLSCAEMDIASLSLVDKEEKNASLAGEQTQPYQPK